MDIYRHNWHHEPIPETREEQEETLDSTEAEDFHHDPYSDAVLVTTLLSQKDDLYFSEKAYEARAKEIQTLEERQWVTWDTLCTLDDFEENEMQGTWSPAQMLCSEKYCELNLPYENKTLKVRLVHQGDREYNHRRENVIEQRRKVLAEKGLSVKPISGTELRGMMILELALALEGNTRQVCG